jgi:hypothetical protein
MKKMLIAVLLVFIGTAFITGQDFGFGDFPSGGMTGLPGMTGAGNKAMDRANDAIDKMAGLIPMRFFNALDRNPIPNATITVPNVGTFTTNNQGKVVLPGIPDGNYTLQFSKDGFVTTPIDFRVILGGVDFNWYSVSPWIPPPPPPPAPPPPTVIYRSYRIVLEWGEKPADLDLHFVKSGGSGNYHISYLNMRTADDRRAILDRDDTNGFGPETITIGRIETNADYICYVHDYTNRSNTSSNQMSQNGAVVRVYSDNSLVNTFRIPANANGTRWNVFKIENGEIIPVNAVIPR